MENTPSPRLYTIKSKTEKIREAIFKKYNKHFTYCKQFKILKNVDGITRILHLLLFTLARNFHWTLEGNGIFLAILVAYSIIYDNYQ